MKVTAREFLKMLTAAVPVGVAGGCAEWEKPAGAEACSFADPGLWGFAAVLAAARTLVGTGRRVEWRIPGGELLKGWEAEGRVAITGVGRRVEEREFRCAGGWRVASGICLELLLRMEIRGPRASTPHPRPGEVWNPVLRVEDLRRLMARMLEESGVEVVSRTGGGPAWRARVPGVELFAGQFDGTRRGLAVRLGRSEEALAGTDEFRRRLARDLSLPG